MPERIGTTVTGTDQSHLEEKIERRERAEKQRAERERLGVLEPPEYSKQVEVRETDDLSGKPLLRLAELPAEARASGSVSKEEENENKACERNSKEELQEEPGPRDSDDIRPARQSDAEEEPSTRDDQVSAEGNQGGENRE